MHSAVQYTRFFRLIYKAAPCSNVLCSVMVCVRNITTMFTTKAFPFSVAHIQAIRTHLRSISRWNSKQFHPLQLSLIGQILPELVKAPTVQCCLLYLALWFCRFTDMAKIFNSNTLIFSLCLCYDVFCYGMVIYRNKPALFAKQSLRLITGWQQLYFQRKFHAANLGLLTNLAKTKNGKVAQFPPSTQSDEWVSLQPII